MEPVVGGTKKHLRQILGGLPQPEFEQSLLCSVERDPGFMPEIRRLRAEGMRVEIVPMKREMAPLSDLNALRRIWRHLSRYRYDIVHTHCAKAGALGRVAALLTRVPRVVHTPHVFPFSQDWPNHRKLEYRLIEKLLSALCDRIIAVSEYQKTLAESHGIGRRGDVVVIPNGVSPSAFEGGDGRRVRKELGLKQADILVGTTGRLSHQKGHKHLLEAAAILLDRHPNLRFFIAGGGELERPLRGMISGLSWCRQRVFFLGERGDVADLLAATDVFVLPSLWEGLPYSLLEAMAAARAVICTDVCGMSEVVIHGVNGLLVPPRDSRALAVALSRLAADRSLRRRLGAAAQQTARERFQLADKLAALASLYRQLKGA